MAGLLTDFGFGGGATSSIVNAFSSGGVSLDTVSAQGSNSAREVLSGALTANVLKSLLLVTGAGELPLLSVYAKNATSRTVRVQVLVDGQATPVFDATTEAIAAAGRGIPVVGFTGGAVPAGSIYFNSSLEVKVASSLAETNNVAIAFVLNKRGG